MKRTKTWVKIQESFWLQPILYGLIASILAYTAINLDFYFSNQALKDVLPKLLLSSTSLETQLASTLAQSILAMMSITFSAIMVVLTTFSSQFSPRTLQNFISDKVTQRILAIFVAGILYNLLILFFIKGSSKTMMFFSPVLSVVLALFCILGFVYYIHHVAKWVQVNELINKVANETMGTVHRVHHEIQHFQKQTKKYRVEDVLNTDPEKIQTKEIRTPESGYIGLIDTEKLVRMAKRDGVVLEFLVHVGAYVIKDKAVMIVKGLKDPEDYDLEAYCRCVKISIERTDVQDVEFGIQKLVEIALRAISPAINDPHTAINCINRIASLISEIDVYHSDSANSFDKNGDLRIIFKDFDFYHYLYKGFYQIRHYGKSDISVVAAIFHAFGLIAENTSREMKKTVYQFAMEIKEGIDESDYLAMDKRYLQSELDFLKKASGMLSE